MNADDFFSYIGSKKILIQGLGLNGGGTATALFFLKKDIPVVITDMKSKEILQSSIDELSNFEDKITYKLGGHDEADFINADIIVKGPGVSPSSKFITLAKANGAEIVSDISIFCQIAPCPIYAITGSKGKSTTVSAVYSIFKAQTDNAFLGGNIAISPLSFYDQLNKDSLVILELSSWQLRDIAYLKYPFKGAAFTNLMNDHQNYYNSMSDYLEDKLHIGQYQNKSNFIIIPSNDSYIKKECFKSNQEVLELNKDLLYEENNAFLFYNNKKEMLFNKKDINVLGEHFASAILFAAGLAFMAGCSKNSIQNGIRNFKGVPFRIEEIRTWSGMKFINDTTATIPQATVLAIKTYNEKCIWIGGGSDKNLDFDCLKEIESIPEFIYFLPGDGTDRIKRVLKRTDYKILGSLKEIIDTIASFPMDGYTVLFSPGCTSFGLFNNEFHRGRIFNDLVKALE